MMTITPPSTRPWRISDKQVGPSIQIDDAEGRLVMLAPVMAGLSRDEALSNAELVVNAVNALANL